MGPRSRPAVSAPRGRAGPWRVATGGASARAVQALGTREPAAAAHTGARAAVSATGHSSTRTWDVVGSAVRNPRR